MRTRTEGRVAARYRWDRLKVSFWFTSAINDPFTAMTCQAGNLIEQARQTIDLRGQALQTELAGAP